MLASISSKDRIRMDVLNELRQDIEKLDRGTRQNDEYHKGIKEGLRTVLRQIDWMLVDIGDKYQPEGI